MSRRRKPLPPGEFSAAITGLSHEGRGIARIDGKTTFIADALPGEQVKFQYRAVRGRFDEGIVTQVESASPDRIIPVCEFSQRCGGCCLHHMDPKSQIHHKQQVLLDLLPVIPEKILPPLTGPTQGYRHKARLGVRWVEKKNKLLIGFREREQPRYLADITSCRVLVPIFGENFNLLSELILSLSCPQAIPQLEIAHGDKDRAIILRYLEPLTPEDNAKLKQFGLAHQINIHCQPGKPDSIDNLTYLQYQLPEFDLTYEFYPNDFTQVNSEINRQMVSQAMALLDPQPDEDILDLFCGLGNFTLPIAQRAKSVLGIEGSAAMVERGYHNAQLNCLENIEFRVADLTQPIALGKFDKILIDPPRSGAKEIVDNIKLLNPKRIIYISCDPATLARDTSILTNQGYKLTHAGVMDMFPHTAHVESMAVFHG